MAGGEVPRELTREGCLELVEAYAEAARRAVAAGFDVINIHGAHGYLIHQFMSPISNHRTDEFAKPEYFMNLVIDAVRQAAPDTIVGMRVSVLEGPADGITAAGSWTSSARHTWTNSTSWTSPPAATKPANGSCSRGSGSPASWPVTPRPTAGSVFRWAWPAA